MKKKIKELWIKEEGNALLLVMLLVMCMLMIGGGIAGVASFHMEMSQAYKNTSSLYYAAQSGAEKIVDQLNKRLIEEMPKLMEESSKEAKNEIAPLKPKNLEEFMPSPDYSKLTYNIDPSNSSPYEGEFILLNRYQDLLKEKAIKTITVNTICEPDVVLMEIDYVIKNEKNYSVVHAELKPKIKSGKVEGLKVLSTATLKKEPFSAEIISKIILEGDIVISDLIGHKEFFLEEYRWMDENLIPNTFRSPILTFGDLVITNDAQVIIEGDVRAKGYIPPHKVVRSNGKKVYPELEEYGGIYVSHGGRLTVYGDVITLSNLHTIKKPNDGDTAITVHGDVFANSVVIEDDYPYINSAGKYNTERFLKDRVEGQKINIYGDVYIDNDIAIDRYVKGNGNEADITITGSVFGITNFDIHSSDPDPNKSSGIYAMGENTQISIGKNVFIHGNAFISFDEGENFSALYESVGAPYEEVNSIDAYAFPPDSDPIYLKLFKNSINTNRIRLNLKESAGNYFYAPYMISAMNASDTEGKVYRGNPDPSLENYSPEKIRNHSLFDDPEELKNLFNRGKVDESALGVINSKWNEKIFAGSSYTIKKIISNGLEFLKGEDRTINPYKRNYFIDGITNYDLLSNYRGIQGYMFIKRDIFYKGIDASSADHPLPVEMIFHGDIISNHSDVVNKLQPLDALDPIMGWKEDQPVYIYNSDYYENKELDIGSFYDKRHKPIKTVIIDKGSGTLTLKADTSSKKEFYGLIISNGRVVFDGVEKFTGVMISKGRIKDANGDGMEEQIFTEELAKGAYAGILIKNDLKIEYDPNVFFDIRCQDRSMKRVILDYLGFTNYLGNTSDVVQILKPSIDFENIQKVDFSSKSVIDIKNTQAYKGVRFEMKTLRQIDE
ncbi:MAG: hypothetical protein JG775_2541 [Defluviitaleaceae bacterium]|jgi:hypothetical protein|uniref:Type 4 fimbrial biogenesis protein PilX N-terminal domain-containing protein n=1 Tax=Defluviitalea raffinosedens TaxID=1450156 RepID=A0A7C8HGJ6_9FIRM|nr:hypothetical protein [Defluviitalea raffinosedens]KAE9637247.1 hypothetical protein GND95_02105 [Defluviitalea raffinosedens]MBZ4669388.1 hypothetical protein [Defluviitaleaceae bacterium]